MIKVKKSKNKGRGIFATKPIRKGQTIEKCHVIVCEKNEWKNIKETTIANYVFGWDKEGAVAMALGSGSLYNHSINPNAEVTMYRKEKLFIYSAIKKIKKGEEILIDYGYSPPGYIKE